MNKNLHQFAFINFWWGKICVREDTIWKLCKKCPQDVRSWDWRGGMIKWRTTVGCEWSFNALHAEMGDFFPYTSGWGYGVKSEKSKNNTNDCTSFSFSHFKIKLYYLTVYLLPILLFNLFLWQYLLTAYTPPVTFPHPHPHSRGISSACMDHKWISWLE